jgi:hypothetical protein
MKCAASGCLALNEAGCPRLPPPALYLVIGGGASCHFVADLCKKGGQLTAVDLIRARVGKVGEHLGGYSRELKQQLRKGSSPSWKVQRDA